MTHSTKALVLLCVRSFFANLVFFAPVALLVRTRNGISQSEFFILQAILSLGIFFFEIPCGVLTDKIGYKKTLILSALFIVVVRAIFTKGGSFFVFAIAAIIEAIALCFASGTEDAFSWEAFGEKDFVEKSAKIGSFSTAAFIISTLLFAPMNSFLGFDSLLWGTLIASFLAFAVLLFVPHERHFSAKAPQQGESKQDGKRRSITTGNVLKILLSKKIIAVFLISSFLSLGVFITNFFFILKLAEAGLSENWMSALILSYSALNLLSPAILSRLSKKSPAIVLTVLFAASALLLLSLSLLSGFAILLPMTLLPLLMSLPSAILSGIENTLIDSLNLGGKRATVLSVMNQGSNLVDVVFLFASSALPSSSTSALFLPIAALFVVLSLFCAFRLKAILE